MLYHLVIAHIDFGCTLNSLHGVWIWSFTLFLENFSILFRIIKPPFFDCSQLLFRIFETLMLELHFIQDDLFKNLVEPESCKTPSLARGAPVRLARFSKVL